ARPARLPGDTVLEPDLPAACQHQGGGHRDEVVEARGCAVRDLEACDRQRDARLLQLAVAQGALPHPLDPAGFEPDRVHAVVDDAHLIRLGEPHPDVVVGGRRGVVLHDLQHSNGAPGGHVRPPSSEGRRRVGVRDRVGGVDSAWERAVTTEKPRGIGVDFQAQTRYRRGQLPASRSRVAPRFKVYANPHEIATLPSPQLKGGTGVWSALSSARGGESEGGRIKQAQLSQLLWAAAGFTVGRQRVHLNAHGVSSLETYVLARKVQDLFAGVYHYDAREHSLEHIEVGDPSELLAASLLAPLELET